MPRSLRPAAALACALAALLAACSGADTVAGLGATPNVGLGKSTSSVSGSMSLGIEGVAVYGSLSASAGLSAFQLAMGSLSLESAFQNVVVISRAKSDVPGAGTHAISDMMGAGEAPADAFTLTAVLRSGTGVSVPLVCAGTGGQFTVASVGGGRLKGTYNATAACYDPANPERTSTVTLSGSYDAVNGTKLVHLPGTARLATDARLAR